MTTHYQVRIGKKAQKKLKKMDKHQSYLIMSRIKKILVNTNNPRQFGSGLVGDRSGEWRYRIGDYRLIASINDETVTILLLEIGYRREIYQFSFVKLRNEQIQNRIDLE